MLLRTQRSRHTYKDLFSISQLEDSFMRKAMLLLTVLGLACTLWAADPFVGTWKMNAAKSKSTIQDMTLTIAAQGDSFKCVQTLAYADGKTTHRSWTDKYDGKDYPMTGDPTVDTISVTKPDANTVKYLFKKNGKGVFSGRSVISKNGKIMTDVGGAMGQATDSTVVMEKQ
jgi:hypothetical protein